jgi:hypothetical protein
MDLRESSRVTPLSNFLVARDCRRVLPRWKPPESLAEGGHPEGDLRDEPFVALTFVPFITDASTTSSRSWVRP